ncbi:MAG: 2-oxoglutarate dehydrogenase, subunit, dihydrolipoamide succinyltransferase [Thermomicrobiales bacterium]|jgi:2-oxoglutarate dehydrogenase E2 component (dihydrolipoamide succinyltransferase)|nr:2-oxoglutarate dehydrogenase, subunit, dihydrolipoamide succinyltransferase [Thermomicrobiales bacterium]
MAVEIRVPPLGESLVDAVVGTWLKREGDAVNRGESLVELETDKVNLDVTAEEDGVLESIARREGEVVTVGEVLGLVGAGNGASAPAPVAETAAPAPATPAPSAVEVPPIAAAAPPPTPAPAPATTPVAPPPFAPADDDVDGAGGRAAPAVRRLAEEHHVDLNSVAGTGPGGRVTREDVLIVAARQAVQAAPTAPTAIPSLTRSHAPDAPPASPPTAAQRPSPSPASSLPPAAPADGREERRRFSRRRQTIANRLVEAQQTAAMLTTFNEADMGAVMELRARRKEAFKERYGVNLGYMSFFTKAIVGALKAFPEMNSELQNDELVLKKYYDIGIAVSTDEGLVVPVVRDADRKTFGEIEKEIAALAKKARDGDLTLPEIQGGTFTITNGGIYGSLNSTPILNVPQVGILGMHTIQERPVARDGEVVIRPMMYLALSYDHRVIDGATAVQFLVKVKQMIEDPETLLIEG